MASVKLFTSVPDSWLKAIDEMVELSPWDRRSDWLREVIKKLVYEFIENRGYLSKVDFSDLIWEKREEKNVTTPELEFKDVDPEFY